MPVAAPPPKSTLPQSLAFLAGLILVVCIYFIWWVVIPQTKTERQNYAQSSAQLAGTEQNIVTLKQSKTQLDAALADLAPSGLVLENVQYVIPKTEDIPTLYVQMEALIQKMPNLTQPSYQIGSPRVATDGAVQVPVTITATGKYNDLRSFLALAENNTRPLTFTSITLSSYLATKGGGAAPNVAAGIPDTSDLYSLTAVGYARAQSLSSAYDPTAH